LLWVSVLLTDDAKNTRRLLIVEDDQATRFALGRILQSAGFDVSLADNLRNALNQWNGQHCVLLDLHLPDGSGLELLAALRDQKYPSPQVAICSAALDSELQAALHTHGPLTVFTKPIDLDALIAWLKSDRLMQS
jgi:DNA-binding response OmpR family regulator